MWNRQELKANGKAAFRRNYWRSVLVAVILAAILGVGAGTAGSSASQEIRQDTKQGTYSEATGNETLDQLIGAMETATAPAVRTAVFAAVLGGSLVTLVLTILVLNPLQVGCRSFFAKNTAAHAEMDELGRGFKRGWGSTVGTMLLMDLFLGLWFLLLIVPGIIKSYSYRLVPYLLAEHPDWKGTKAITVSRQWMKGNKWKAFVLDLSFIGWELLSALTCGILGIFYVNPYVQATDAELYRAIAAAHTGETL